MDAEVVGRHIHVANGHQRAAHVDADRRTLVRVVIVVVANLAYVGRCASSRLKILHALHVFRRVRGLLLMLRLVTRISFAAACSRQFALGRISIFGDIDAGVHLLGLFRGDCSSLARGRT